MPTELLMMQPIVMIEGLEARAMFSGATLAPATAALSAARYLPAAVAHSGKVYVAGGVDRSISASDALDIYDSDARTFTPATLPQALVGSAFNLRKGLLFIGATSSGNT